MFSIPQSAIDDAVEFAKKEVLKALPSSIDAGPVSVPTALVVEAAYLMVQETFKALNERRVDVKASDDAEITVRIS